MTEFCFEIALSFATEWTFEDGIGRQITGVEVVNVDLDWLFGTRKRFVACLNQLFKQFLCIDMVSKFATSLSGHSGEGRKFGSQTCDVEALHGVAELFEVVPHASRGGIRGKLDECVMVDNVSRPFVLVLSQ